MVMNLNLSWAWGNETLRPDGRAWFCIYAFTGVIGIFANVLVLVVFLRNLPGHRNITAKLIIHQSIIDLMSSVVFLPFYIIPEGWLIQNEDAGEVFCKARTIFWVLATSSTTNLVFITIERYYAIVYPIKHYVHFKNGKFYQALPIIYIYGFLGMGHLVFVADINENYYCYYNWEETSENLQFIIGIISFCFTWLIPTSIIIYVYATIIFTLRNMHRGFPDGGGTVGSRRRYLAQKNLINTFIAVSVAYAVCWTPDMFLYLTFNVTSSSYPDMDGIAHRITVFLSVCNMVVNPFIYAFKYRDFKTGLSKMFSDIKVTSRGN
ncbi:somatostatin receptor type 2-like [Anneissia japonica]|uniref:somatostatin receptor type 2-like n=1 Tax=Anneissia japonica TaxID=1529436 RepID=UPI001425838F|nr:somatostatin receptor type 2-like [Anneissia japonica]